MGPRRELRSCRRTGSPMITFVRAYGSLSVSIPAADLSARAAGNHVQVSFASWPRLWTPLPSRASLLHLRRRIPGRADLASRDCGGGGPGGRPIPGSRSSGAGVTRGPRQSAIGLIHLSRAAKLSDGGSRATGVLFEARARCEMGPRAGDKVDDYQTPPSPIGCGHVVVGQLSRWLEQSKAPNDGEDEPAEEKHCRWRLD